jgi:HAMP domain-containing protein
LSIELLSSLGIVVVLCIVALYTVRRGLRPLEDMAQTAGEIAGGDLSQRVLAEDPTSEVGRLGAALNYMLGEIEAAFAEKTTSEDRLRQFVADASHELRTPLTSIRGYSELLRKGAFTDEENRHRALTRVEEEAARMGGLVDDLLLLARLDQGRSLQMTPVNLVRVGFDAVDDARAVSPGREIILIEQAPVVVVGDRAQPDPQRVGPHTHRRQGTGRSAPARQHGGLAGDRRGARYRPRGDRTRLRPLLPRRRGPHRSEHGARALHRQSHCHRSGGKRDGELVARARGHFHHRHPIAVRRVLIQWTCRARTRSRYPGCSVSGLGIAGSSL